MSSGKLLPQPGAMSWLGVSLALIAVAGFLARHPFQGIIHDDILYLGQALRSIDPSRLNHDFFFAHGSQDSFTLFPPLYGGVIGAFGIDAAVRLLLVLGQMLWLLCAFLLIRQILPRRLALLGLLFLAIYPTGYGGNDVLRIGEPFVTPRLFSEALGLGAIAAYLAARVRVSVVLLAAAALLHPLMAIAPAAAIVITAVTRRRSALAPAAAVGVLALGFLLLLFAAHALSLPFATVIDPEWKSLASHRSRHLFISEWQAEDWLSMAGDSILVAIASFAAPPLVRRLLIAVLAICLASILVSFIGFDLLSDLRIGQLQLWRSLWLLRVLAPIGLLLIISEAQEQPSDLRRPILLYAFATPVFALLGDLAAMPELVVSPIIVLAVLWLRERSTQNSAMLSRLMVPLAYLLFTLLCGLMLAGLVRTADFLVNEAGNLTLAPAWQFMVQWALPIPMLCIGLALFLRQSRSVAGAVLGLLALCASLLFWDRRSDWQRYVDSQPDLASELGLPLAPEESVYWPGNIVAIWADLRRASYFSMNQGAGLIFHRETAVEYRRRFGIVQMLEPTDSWARAIDMPDNPHALRDTPRRDITYADLTSICSQQGGPDVVILNIAIPEAHPKHWRSPVDFAYFPDSQPSDSAKNQTIPLKRGRDVYVYRCRDVAAQLPAGGT